jgi:hypothetical protein
MAGSTIINVTITTPILRHDTIRKPSSSPTLRDFDIPTFQLSTVLSSSEP